jgi:hypothetical protein
MAYFTEADQSFLTETADKIPGWLMEYAGRITLALLNFQDEKDVSGSLMEIGVYGGRYFSLLYRSAQKRRSNLLGIDPFEHFSPEQIATNLGTKLPRDNIHFIKGFSADFRAADLMAFLGEKARFVSLDGSHDAVDVLGDLHLSYEVLHPRGIVAVDDFFNTECFGVVEAVCRFLDRCPGLVPFLYTSNKLFMAPVHSVETYYDFVETFAAADSGNAQSANFTEARSRNKKWAQTALYGHTIFTI